MSLLLYFSSEKGETFQNNLTFEWVGGCGCQWSTTIQYDFRVFKKPTFVPLSSIFPAPGGSESEEELRGPGGGGGGGGGDQARGPAPPQERLQPEHQQQPAQQQQVSREHLEHTRSGDKSWVIWQAKHQLVFQFWHSLADLPMW